MCICSCILHGWYLMSQVLLLMHHPSHGRGLTSFCVSSLKTTRLISSIYILHDEHYVSQLGVNHVYYCICITTVIKTSVHYKQTRISPQIRSMRLTLGCQISMVNNWVKWTTDWWLKVYLFVRKYIFNCYPVRNVASVLKRW